MLKHLFGEPEIRFIKTIGDGVAKIYIYVCAYCGTQVNEDSLWAIEDEECNDPNSSRSVATEEELIAKDSESTQDRKSD